jgi:hypothetical protein
MKYPPAAQLPGDAHDIELTCEIPQHGHGASSPARPGTSIALPHRPCCRLTTNACVKLAAVVEYPVP